MSTSLPDHAPEPIPQPQGAAVPPLTYASVAVYVVAFFLPYEQGYSGFDIFCMGLVYCWHPLIGFPWWANLFWMIGVVRLMLGKAAAVVSAWACGLAALHVVLWWSLPPGPAYYAWAGSMLLLLVAASTQRTAQGGTPTPAAND